MPNISEVKALLENIVEATVNLKISDKSEKLKKLEIVSQEPEFWSNNLEAGSVMQQINNLKEQTEPWVIIKKETEDLLDILKISDDDMAAEIDNQFLALKQKFERQKKTLRFTGRYDDSDAIVSIHAGAGGTDAQDWAQMLLRMYSRWAENNDIKITLLEESSGEEAGLKSVSFELNGSYIYGKMRGEHGVHRLVRLSPFNADAKRQTSFAKVEVLPKIEAPEEVPIDETELKVDVFRSGGKGGQSVNTTDSAVRITHLPTNIVVSIQNERSQLQNKETAMTILRSKLAQLKEEQHLEALSDIKGPNQSAEWGNQIRSYVLHPYTMVKDIRTRHETNNAQGVLDGDLNPFIEAYLEANIDSSDD